MSDRSRIEWTDATWNPITGCSPVSEGCVHCYAARMAKRLAGRCGYPADNPFQVTEHSEKLEEPLAWKKPRRVFVCSMGDLFHDDVGTSVRRIIWQTMARAHWHTFIVLTKRPDRMWSFINSLIHEKDFFADAWEGPGEATDRFPNVWLGVSAENQQRADERIDVLQQIPAAKHFVSFEPLLGLITPLLKGIDWVICGGETGSDARPMHPDWVRGLRDQCQAAGVPFFFKNWGNWVPNDDRNAVWGSRYHMPWNYHTWDYVSGFQSVRVGKKRAGRLLDGREWNEFPQELR